MRKLILFLCGAAAVAALPLSAKDKPVRPRITGIASVRLLVTDAQRSRDFYSGILALGPGANRCPKGQPLCFSIQQDQQIELRQAETAKDPNLLLEVAFETGDAAQLRGYLQSKGAEPGELTKSAEGNQSFAVLDPEGHRIVFIQYPSSDNSITVVNQVSTHMIHAGFVVHDRAAEDRFYKDILGFHVYWHGGMKGGEDNWVDMQVPDGTDWIEYMLNVSPNASHKTLGVMNHIALGVPDIHAAQQQLIKNGWKPTEEPKIGRDGKWQLNLYDPDETRVELMEFKPTKEPCCSPYTGPHPGPKQ
jgi:catechol 2,3-dioxygenase-like lactoylglutathione lyase family enzyme